MVMMHLDRDGAVVSILVRDGHDHPVRVVMVFLLGLEADGGLGSPSQRNQQPDHQEAAEEEHSDYLAWSCGSRMGIKPREPGKVSARRKNHAHAGFAGAGCPAARRPQLLL